MLASTISLLPGFSQIRIWNYNASRSHVGRGARDVVISVDHKPVFKVVYNAVEYMCLGDYQWQSAYAFEKLVEIMNSLCLLISSIL
jgi:hypothetical protein